MAIASFNLLEPGRVATLHDLRQDGDIWISTGIDPYIVFHVDKHFRRGCFVIDLTLHPLSGSVDPKLFFAPKRGFSEQASTIMRMRGHGSYRVIVLVGSVQPIIRLDPSEQDCSFRITHFNISRVSPAIYATRTLRNGKNRHDGSWSMDYALTAARRFLRTGVSPEIADPNKFVQTSEYTYEDWIKKYEAPVAKLTQRESEHLGAVATILFVTKVEVAHGDKLKRTIGSIEAQLLPNWRLLVLLTTGAAGSASEGAEEWQTEYRSNKKICIYAESSHHLQLDSLEIDPAKTWFCAIAAGDTIGNSLTYECTKKIDSNPAVQLIYTDEDTSRDNTGRTDPNFKPEWNAEMLLHYNYIGNAALYRLQNVLELETWWKSDFSILALRIGLYLADTQVEHVEKVLYHTAAASETETNHRATTLEEELLVIRNYLATASPFTDAEAAPLEEAHRGATIYKLRYKLPEEAPMVSIIIPTRNGHDILRKCVESIYALTSYKNFEIVVIDNGTDDPQTVAYFAELVDSGLAKVVSYPGEFNYSAINNFGARQAKGSVFCLLNNDVEVIAPDWLSEMTALALVPRNGCVGAKLYYSNDTVQHAGVILGLGGVAGHSHKEFPRRSPGYQNRLRVRQNVSAVTAACLVIRKEVFWQVGGLDEVNLPVAYNDVDLCLKVQEAGYVNVWTPYAELYHHESVSRGSDFATPAKRERYMKEVKYMKSRWGNMLTKDKYYSPNLTVVREDFSLRS